LEDANIALDRFRAGQLSGTAVLLISKAGHPDRSETPHTRSQQHPT